MTEAPLTLLQSLRMRLQEAKIAADHPLWQKVRILEINELYTRALAETGEAEMLGLLQQIVALDGSQQGPPYLLEEHRGKLINKAISQKWFSPQDYIFGTLRWALPVTSATPLTDAQESLTRWLAHGYDPIKANGTYSLFTLLQGSFRLPTWLFLYRDSKEKERQLPEFADFINLLYRHITNNSSVITQERLPFAQEDLIELFTYAYSTYGTLPGAEWFQYAIEWHQMKLLGFFQHHNLPWLDHLNRWGYTLSLSQRLDPNRASSPEEQLFMAFLLDHLQQNPARWSVVSNYDWQRLRTAPSLLERAHNLRMAATGTPLNANSAVTMHTLPALDNDVIIKNLHYLPAVYWTELESIWNTCAKPSTDGYHSAAKRKHHQTVSQLRQTRALRLAHFLTAPGLTEDQWKKAREQDRKREDAAAAQLAKGLGLGGAMEKTWRTKCNLIAIAISHGRSDIINAEMAPYPVFPYWHWVANHLLASAPPGAIFASLQHTPKPYQLQTFCSYLPRCTNITQEALMQASAILDSGYPDTKLDPTARPGWLLQLSTPQRLSLLRLSITIWPELAMHLLDTQDGNAPGVTLLRHSANGFFSAMLQACECSREHILHIMLAACTPEDRAAAKFFESIQPKHLSRDCYETLLRGFTPAERKAWWAHIDFKLFDNNIADLWLTGMVAVEAHKHDYTYSQHAATRLLERFPKDFLNLLQGGGTLPNEAQLFIHTCQHVFSRSQDYLPILHAMVARGADPFVLINGSPAIEKLQPSDQAHVLEILVGRITHPQILKEDTGTEPMITTLNLA